uniref:Putative secreted peptide n=1 Tax=Anopheles braziliensis TaxID=58242 RepID=A0A2M3ZX39_9DIPT
MLCRFRASVSSWFSLCTVVGLRASPSSCRCRRRRSLTVFSTGAGLKSKDPNNGGACFDIRNAVMPVLPNKCQFC